MTDRYFAIIKVSSELGLAPAGVENLPDALRKAGLKRRLRARDAGNLPSPPYDPRRDPETGVLNPLGIAHDRHALASVVTEAIDIV